MPDPLRPEGGRTVYNTGDLARHAAGRFELECPRAAVDDQVKLRGFRIELGEIEAVVAEEPAVTQCAAVVREDTPGDQRLVAYYTAAGEVSVEALRERARQRLPAYMVPSAFVALEEIPLTPNAKVDRRALLAREPEGTVPDAEYVAPQGELEERIAGIWGRALKVERVPVHASFFDLGGHSLLLAEVHAGIVEELGSGVTMVELFQYPTVSGLARHLEEAGGAGPRQRMRGRERRSAGARRRARG